MIPVVLFTLAATSGTLDRLTQEVAASGQVVELAVKPADRVSPPVEIARPTLVDTGTLRPSTSRTTAVASIMRWAVANASA